MALQQKKRNEEKKKKNNLIYWETQKSNIICKIHHLYSKEIPTINHVAAVHTWEVTPGNKPPKKPQNSHLNGV